MFPAAGPRWKQGSINALSDAGATCDLVTQKVATCWQHCRHCEIRLERSILAKGCGKKIDLTRCHSKAFFEGIHGDLPMALICGWELLVVDLDDCFRIIQGIFLSKSGLGGSYGLGIFQSPIQITGASWTLFLFLQMTVGVFTEELCLR